MTSGLIHLGVTKGGGQPFGLSLDEISSGGAFLIGGTGSGKTTTMARLADGMLGLGGSVIVVDCKGSGNTATVVRGLAGRHDVPLHVVDPLKLDRSLGYDPCRGWSSDPETAGSAVANKIVGSFDHSPAGEVYEKAELRIMSVACKAMFAARIDVSLAAIFQCLSPGGLARLGRL